MSRFFVAVIALAFGGDLLAAPPLTDEQQEVSRSGDALQYAVPIGALALTFLLHRNGGGDSDLLGLDLSGADFTHMNASPRHDLALAMARSIAITEGLKFAVSEQRPNGGAHSFPSGHTSFAFTGAEFIRKEYGWQWGIPAYLLAGYVGYSRIESDAHYPHDVVAGAALGILANHDFGELTTRYGNLSFSSSFPGHQSFASQSSQLDRTVGGEQPTLGISFKLKF